uniref:MRH domain-containing protein n=1 Tax=Globisporangium ultimum (strain ATCC 200006 / CBS 805.95 / DAOM BR144) TaxID=431595 RepID=K3WA16_GLOUD
MRLVAAAAVAALATVSTVQNAHALQLPSSDASYVVQIHASRDGAPLGALDPATTRSQVMTIESGQQFECFVPLTPEKKQAALAQQQQQSDHADQQHTVADDAEEGEAASFLAFGRTAAKKIRPKCVQYVDIAENWVYEVCPGVLVRKVSLRARPQDDGDDTTASNTASTGSAPSTETAKKKRSKKPEAGKREQSFSHDVVELGEFVGDTQAKALGYSDFVGADTQERVKKYQKPLFTQHFRVGGTSSPDTGDDELLQVQFMCSATTLDDTVAGVRWKKTTATATTETGRETSSRSVAGFLVLSRFFCDPKYTDAEEFKLFTVQSLLRPLVDSKTCIKRSEGWWTYEFCFGRGIRQYHRDSEGRITAEFSLGTFDAVKNAELAEGGALVTEHIDATHDVSRPAYLELYDQGTHCKEFDRFTPRKAKVYYYCNEGGSNHFILGVKETQTCVYSIKISSPVLCDHPHFANDEQSSEDKAEIVHCVPLEEAHGQQQQQDEEELAAKGVI